jgi:hypothetical protein
MNSKTSLLFAVFTANMTISISRSPSVRSYWMGQSSQRSARNTESYGLGRLLRKVVTASLLAIATASPLMAEVPKQARGAMLEALDHGPALAPVVEGLDLRNVAAAVGGVDCAGGLGG